jgi:hypothetical protein
MVLGYELTNEVTWTETRLTLLSNLKTTPQDLLLQ